MKYIKLYTLLLMREFHFVMIQYTHQCENIKLEGRLKIRLFSDQCHPVNAYSLCFVDITASYWWIYYFFDGCHKKQWGELWWKWYMLMYLICICIFIRPWCNRVLIKSMMCKHSSIDYIVMHFLINVVSYFIVICLMKTSSCILYPFTWTKYRTI